MSVRNLIDTAKPGQPAAGVPAYAWIILAVTMLAGVTAPLTQFKVPPVMPVLMEQFHLDLGSAGLLMSIFAITGLIMALPAGIILQRIGPKISGLIALGCLLGGSILGAFAASAQVLLFTRLIEGVGMGLIAVVAPAIISAWFPPEKRGLPMGIWATWVSLGSLIIYILAPALNTLAGWRSVWWASACFALVAFLLYWMVIRLPAAVSNPAIAQKPAASPVDLSRVLRNRSIWLLALSFAAFNLVVIGVIATYFPTYLKTVRGFNLADASSITSLKMIAVIATAPLAGWLMDKIGSYKRIAMLSFLALSVYMLMPFSVDGWLISASMLLLGVIVGAIPSATFSAAPEMMGNREYAGIGLAVVMIGQNLGQLAGPLIFSRLVEGLGWTAAAYWMVPVVLIGLAAIYFAKMR